MDGKFYKKTWKLSFQAIYLTFNSPLFPPACPLCSGTTVGRNQGSQGNKPINRHKIVSEATLTTHLAGFHGKNMLKSTKVKFCKNQGAGPKIKILPFFAVSAPKMP